MPTSSADMSLIWWFSGLSVGVVAALGFVMYQTQKVPSFDPHHGVMEQSSASVHGEHLDRQRPLPSGESFAAQSSSRDPQKDEASPAPTAGYRSTTPGQRVFVDGDRSPNFVSGTSTSTHLQPQPSNRSNTGNATQARASEMARGTRNWKFVHSNSCSRLDQRSDEISQLMKVMGTRVPDWRLDALREERSEIVERRKLGMCH